MQNKGRITAISLAVSAVLVGCSVFVYMANKSINAREQQIYRGFEKLEKILPPNLKQENVFSKGFLSSKGVYKLNYAEKGSKDSLIMDYKINHGLSSWMGGDIEFNSKINLTSDKLKNFKTTAPQWMTLNGVIKKDGSFDMKGVGSEIIVISEAQMSNKLMKAENISRVTIDKSNLLINYSNSSGAVKSELTYPLITVSGKESATIKNVQLGTNFNVSQPDLGEVILKAEQITDKSIDLKGLELYGKVGIEKEKLNILTSLKVANLAIAPIAQKDIALELSYSLKGLDKSALTLYKEVYSKSENPSEITEETKKKFALAMKEIIKTGLTISLDKLYVKNPKGLIDFSGAIEVKPVATVKDISFEKNTKLKFNLLISGEYAQMIKAFIPQEQKDLILLDAQNNIKMSLVFDAGVFKLNDKDFAPEYNNQINIALQGLDEEIKK